MEIGYLSSSSDEGDGEARAKDVVSAIFDQVLAEVSAPPLMSADVPSVTSPSGKGDWEDCRLSKGDCAPGDSWYC